MNPSAARGFSLVEVMIVLAFLVIVLAMAVPTVGTIHDEDQAKEVLDLIEDLHRACAEHHRDTQRYAIEFSPAANGSSYTQPRYHELSLPQRTLGWAGPYLSEVLDIQRNPFRGAIYVQNHLAASPANGFDLDGDGEIDADSSGQFVVIYGVPERIARMVDEVLDGGSARVGDSWMLRGRVEWSSSAGGALVVCLMSKEG